MNKCHIYLVVNCLNSPGKIAAVFAHKEDAELFAEHLTKVLDEFEVIEKRLWYGQPDIEGYNK